MIVPLFLFVLLAFNWVLSPVFEIET